MLQSERDIEAYENEMPLEVRIPATVYEVFLAGAERFGDAKALTMVMTGESGEQVLDVSFFQLRNRITQTANMFSSIAGKGVGVAYILPSLLETQYTLWGAETAGYAVPLNPLLQAEHLLALVQASGAQILVTCGPGLSAEIWAKAQAIKAELPNLAVVCVNPCNAGEAAPEGCFDFHAAVGKQSAASLSFPLETDPHRVVAYFHTGGTTGMPKLVAHTNRNQLTAALGTVCLLGLQSGDVVTNGMPLFHVGGAIASSLAFYMSGGQVVTLSPAGLRNPAMVKNFWRILERHKVTILGAVPTALSAIVNVPVDADLSSVKLGITGSASTPRRVAERFAEVTGRALHEILGMTESGGVTAADPAGSLATTGSVGYRLPYTKLSVRRRNADGTLGEECGADEVGVLTVSGPNVSPGYRQEVPGASTFVDGVLNTGDLAYRNQAGKFFIAGRVKDLIIRSGHNIDPSTIESAFLGHPEVIAAAAVGEPDAYAGELPACYVVLAQGSMVTAEELLEFAKQRINERPAWPKHVYTLPALPMTGVGKIYKPALRADAAQRVLSEALRSVAGTAVEEVAVKEGGSKGLRVRVRVSDASEEVRAKLNALLGAYVVESELVYE